MKPTFNQLWGWPLATGLLSASGLLSALVSEGWGDVWSWVALGGPCMLMAWLALARRGHRGAGKYGTEA
jgi:hypothetical protein